MGFNSLFPCVCHRPVLQASVVTIFSLLPLKCAGHGRVVNSCFIFSKSELRSVVQSHFVPFLSNFLILPVVSDKFGMNSAKYCIAPRKDFSVLVYVGGSSLFIAPVFSLFGLMLYCDNVCQAIVFLFGRILISSCLLGILCLPIWSVPNLIFRCVLFLSRGLQLWCRLTKQVFGVPELCLFSLGKWLVCRLDRRILLGIGNIR